MLIIVHADTAEVIMPEAAILTLISRSTQHLPVAAALWLLWGITALGATGLVSAPEIHIAFGILLMMLVALLFQFALHAIYPWITPTGFTPDARTWKRFAGEYCLILAEVATIYGGYGIAMRFGWM